MRTKSCYSTAVLQQDDCPYVDACFKMKNGHLPLNSDTYVPNIPAFNLIEAGSIRS